MTKLQLIIEALNRSDPAFKDLQRQLGDSQNQTNRMTTRTNDLTSSLKRLAGSIVTVTAALKTLRFGIDYLSQIETAGLGIAAAFMTGGKYIDETSGKALTAQKALAAAQRDSALVIKDLQYANLQTIATLDELIRAYQETLPVALAKGFDRKQVQEFTVAMVQAAGAIGLEMNMLGEETRSMLTGAINPRSSRIATVLGLRNEDIRQFKDDANSLFSFLMDKLAAYKAAGVESQQTWAGIWSNFKDIAGQALGQALEPLFDAIKSELSSISENIVKIDNVTKKIKWNPDFMKTVKDIRMGIASIIAEVYRMGMLLDKVGAGYKSYRANVYGALWMDKDSEAEWKKYEEYRRRYMESERKLQDMAMREVGYRPVTPEIDKRMREASSAGLKKYQQEVVEVGSREEGTLQLLRYYREINKEKAQYEATDPKPGSSEEEVQRLKKLRDEWDKTSRTLASDTAKQGLDDFDKKLAEITDKTAELLIQYREVPGAKKEILAWGRQSMDKAFQDEQVRMIEAQRAAGEARIKAREELETRITAVSATELDKRLRQADDEQRRQQELAAAAYDRATPEGARAYNEALIRIDKESADARKKIQADYQASVREMNANAQLAALDLAEKEGKYHRDTLEERKRLLEELIHQEEEHLASMQKVGNEQAWTTQLNKVNAYKAVLAGVSMEMRPAAAQLQKYAEEATNLWENLGKTISSAFSSMDEALADFVMDGKRDFSDLANSIIKDMIRIMIQASVTGPLASAAGSIDWGDLFKGIIGGIGQHGGGVGNEATFYRLVPAATFLGAPRFHGGIGPGERAAILRNDEGVFTPGQMKALGLMTRTNQTQNIKVELVNKSGQPLQTSRSETGFNGQEYVVTVWLDALQRNVGGLRDVMGGS